MVDVDVDDDDNVDGGLDARGLDPREVWHSVRDDARCVRDDEEGPLLAVVFWM